MSRAGSATGTGSHGAITSSPLSGEGEIGLGDGTAHRIGPGRVMLVEDLTGQGHTTRVTSSVPRVTVAIPLADQTPTPLV